MIPLFFPLKTDLVENSEILRNDLNFNRSRLNRSATRAPSSCEQGGEEIGGGIDRRIVKRFNQAPKDSGKFNSPANSPLKTRFL